MPMMNIPDSDYLKFVIRRGDEVDEYKMSEHSFILSRRDRTGRRGKKWPMVNFVEFVQGLGKEAEYMTWCRRIQRRKDGAR